MKKKALALLTELAEAAGPSGFESPVRAIVQRELATNLSCCRSGSIICEAAGAQPGPRVMVSAHLDEVGFVVQNITAEGYLKFMPLGGWWGHTLLSQRVRVLTRSGESVLGVVSSKPPHFLEEAERKVVLPLDRMFIDVGGNSRQEVEQLFGIRVGDPVVPVSEFTTLHNPDLLLCKAFDNRVGTAVMVQAMLALRPQPHPNTLLAVGTVQEEVGTRGAQTACALARPDVALILEGAPADDSPGFNRQEAQGKLGGGVQIRMLDPTAIMNRNLVEFAIACAEREGIKYQLAVRTSGGTDAKVVHLAQAGVPTVVLGVPSRYIHTHNTIIDLNDYLETLKLVEAMAMCLDRATVEGFTAFL